MTSEAADRIHQVLARIQGDPRMVTAAGQRTAARLAAAAANLCADPSNCRTCHVQCRDDIFGYRY